MMMGPAWLPGCTRASSPNRPFIMAATVIVTRQLPADVEASVLALGEACAGAQIDQASVHSLRRSDRTSAPAPFRPAASDDLNVLYHKSDDPLDRATLLE